MKAYWDSSALVQATDFLHACAAEKANADRLLTVDENDFESLLDSVQIEQL
jgi:hypothetical protein